MRPLFLLHSDSPGLLHPTRPACRDELRKARQSTRKALPGVETSLELALPTQGEADHVLRIVVEQTKDRPERVRARRQVATQTIEHHQRVVAIAGRAEVVIRY